MSAVLEHTPTHSNRLRVVMAGPLPPAIGGMVTVIDDLRTSRLARDVDLVLFDTKKTTPVNRSLLEGVTARLGLWARWWTALRGRGTIAHIHTCSGLSFFLDGSLLLLARLRGVPALLHIHGGLFEDFLKSLSPAARWLARLIARAADRVIVLSSGWQARLAPLLPGARLTVVENGISLPDTPAARAGMSVPSILFLGNVSTAKGVEDLIDAVARLKHPFRLVLVGSDEPEGTSTRMHSRAMQLGISEQVVFAGPAYGAAKHEHLRSADVFVLPSHVEALPMALLEAMANGLPVVATRVGAIPSVVESEHNGLLIEPRDVPALAQALERLLGDASLRTRLGANARQLAHERYGVDRAADELMQLYKHMTA